MNGIYSLRDGVFASEIIVVPVFSRKSACRSFRRFHLSVLFLTSTFSVSAECLGGTVNNELNHQLFCGSALNKGVFRFGQQISPFIIIRESL